MSETRSVTSPDGRIRIDYCSHEMRMSHWVEVPTVVDLATGRTIFKPSSTSWHGCEAWGDTSARFTLWITLYPHGGNSVPLDFDVEAGTVRLGDDPRGHPVGEAARLVETHFAAQAGNSPTAPPSRPARTRLIENRWLDAVLGIGFLLGTAIAIWIAVVR